MIDALRVKAQPELTPERYRAYWRDKVDQIYRARALPPLRLGLERVPRFRWVDQAQFSILAYLTAAWEKGAAEYGIKPSEFTAAEQAQLARIVEEQSKRDWLNDFYDAIVQAFEAGQDPPYYRADMWSNRWGQVYNEAKAVFGRNKKLKWVLGETHEHCRTCFGLNGRVYRAETWNENGALPQTHALECQGYNCLCRLEETTDRITPGPFPRGLLVS